MFILICNYIHLVSISFYFSFRFEDLNNQYDEYQKQSSELEHELETQLKQSEERIKNFENKTNRLHIDNETLKVTVYLFV